ncbi:hypothetical protein A5886_001263 [Enterococcus sp. 8G7_MSG3316]|uniref:Uncharacterized protein n=1 Tax=Candidatus Enterococcus testudinis TaxID=1834191 RepID=A0A242A571_9ENTE|nr:hypothetical protein [Enterococcus sp. 8G7_MSG3316]OTN76186.1 hypothetical protein A5886_001263 [Enterococcus sp. 8G7_MSG3316]
MDNIDFNTSINQLRSGEIKELLVTQTQFLVFRDVWLQLDDRVNFVGEAGLNGTIIYRYQSENK